MCDCCKKTIINAVGTPGTNGRDGANGADGAPGPEGPTGPEGHIGADGTPAFKYTDIFLGVPDSSDITITSSEYSICKPMPEGCLGTGVVPGELGNLQVVVYQYHAPLWIQLPIGVTVDPGSGSITIKNSTGGTSDFKVVILG